MSSDLTVIGSGPGGYVAAVLGAKNGLDVTVVEDGDIGGVCTNRGCIPSKALLSVAEKIGTIKGARRDGIKAEIQDIDFDKVMGKKERAVKISRKAIQNLFEKHGIDVVEGKGKVKSSKVVKVKKDGETEEIESDKIIIATGSEPISLPDLEIDEEEILSSRGALELEDLPGSMLIVGGGYIGIEMAFIYSALGTDITIVELEDRLLPLMDRDLSEVSEQMMKRKRITVHKGSKVTSAEGKGPVKVKIEGDTEKEKEVEKVLCSVGRRPSPPETDLDIIGERGEVKVDDTMKTKVDGVYGIGDVNGKIMLAHAAFKQAEIAIDDILGNDPDGFSRFEIPAGIYTHPEMASVGMTEKEAEEELEEVKIGKFPISGTGRGSSTGERMGLAKVIATGDDEVVGTHLACPGATDIIMECVAALENGMDVQELAELVHPHPTYSEAIKEAAENVFGESIHTTD
ncbi:MAG: dihydrolipoyl dehydrogenase [Candidatus Thermoplasmatota archaeon]|nr:dihydrolipoyl dehydrogenase [Candidatus Thermoplasmatota archaeon]